MRRFGRGLCVLLAGAVLWVTPAAAVSPTARAEVSCVAGAQSRPAQRVGQQLAPSAEPRPLPDPRELRALAERASHRFGPHVAAPPRCERIYIEYCVLQR